MNMIKHTWKAKSTFFIIAGILGLSLTGCKPTPERPPIVGKGDGKLEEKIKDSGVAKGNSSINIPQEVKHDFASGKLSVNMDAKIEAPNASKIPVVKVTPSKFSQEQVDQITKTLMQGKPIYKKNYTMTKAQMEEQLVMLKGMLSKQEPKNDSSDKDKKGRISEKLKMSIEKMEKDIPNAPETIEKEISDGKLQTTEEGFQQLDITAELGKKKDANLNVYLSKSGKVSSVWFTNEDKNWTYLSKQSILDKQPRGVNITKEEAEALAVKTFKDMGCDLKLSAVRLGTAGGPDVMKEEPPEAYVFWFTREVGGIPTVYETNDGAMVDAPADEEAQYFEPYAYERAYVTIDDSGIVEMQWTSPMKVMENISDNVEMLPFDEVMNIFDKQFFVRNALKDGDTDIKQATFKVDRITLGFIRVPVKDKPNEYMLIPVWDFFGTKETEFKDSNKKKEIYDSSNESFFTINAIDGSIIERSKGAGIG
jgi:hypothetical protein